ncbi:Arm DNA-binding domain-containing protein [Pseudomonas nitroreducens]|uniref:Arm DNA-binding domain-containing protein n=1 Tax=Pseudomonas nitroreducens TaxID=46680 RepID=UPI000A004A1B|nr:Arm DNA-binding domain-containing protein [Pseudomonas nitroreducens]NMZ58304.1 DUF4102 domain-containing protein [Pseudomonas nitroreducens]SNS15344.1 protein of unknown function [Pseudomonas nitroreducens]
MSATLDDSGLSALQPKDRPYKVSAGAGLFLEVNPHGSKLWRLKYRFGGKENRISLGAFPAVSLEQARQARDEAREMLKAGTDPSAVRKEAKAEQQNQRARAKAFRLVMSLDGALTIEIPAQILNLNPAQTAAIRAFLHAVPMGGSDASD